MEYHNQSVGSDPVANNKSMKDKEMAAMLKANHVERHSGRCPICYGMMPNGTFYPAEADRHFLTCKGPPSKASKSVRRVDIKRAA